MNFSFLILFAYFLGFVLLLDSRDFEVFRVGKIELLVVTLIWFENYVNWTCFDAVFVQWAVENNANSVPPSQYNPLDEPSPLGLKLRKSPSLLDLIQMKLSEGGPSTLGAAQSGSVAAGVKKETKANAPIGAADKLKASNFPASLLRIGCWEVSSFFKHCVLFLTFSCCELAVFLQLWC